tara:strand:- start:2762 stop:4420 length:1659 start_codon:yes stop_codon:yes gene_type:complete
MNIQDISKDLLASVTSILEKKNVKEVDEPKAKGEKDFKDLHTKNVKVHTEKKTNECKSEKDFKPHMMYDPKTGKGYKAKTYDDHVRMDKMGYTHDKPEVKEVDEPTAKGEKDFKDLHLKDLEVYTEKLDPKADASEWIEDFLKSDAPQFKGKSKEERKKMALAAYYSAREKAGLDEDRIEEATGKEIAAKMMKDKMLKPFASKVAKMKSVTAKDLDKMLPDYIAGGDISSLFEGADKDVKGDKEAYRKFFQGMLKKFGVKSPAELSGDKEKEFYDAIDAGWKADNEPKESIEEMKEPFIVIDTADDNKVVGTASNEKGAERIISSAERPPISIKDKKTLKIVKSNKKQNVGFPLKEMKSATGYEIYHKDFSSAMQHAYDFAKKKLKVEVDPEEISREVAMGPKRPSKGKTNSYRLKGKGGAIQVQVYNTGKNYELNMYKESVDEETLEERAKSMEPKKKLKIFNELKKGDKIGIAYDTPMAKADIYKDGKLVYREFTVTRNKTVVGKARVEKITLAKDNVKSGVKFFLYNRDGKVSMAIGDLAAVIIDMKKM